MVESKTLPRRSTAAVSEVLPPPPQYKGVHFAPQLEAGCKRRKSHEEIPSEGLPLGPAIPKAETVAIQVRNNPVPLLSSVKANPSGSTGTATSTFEPKNISSQKQVLGVRDKALKASAAGCEIVFVSTPDHEIVQKN